MMERWKAEARKLKTEIRALALASRDPRTPWHARAVVVLVVAYALSPIDLIPDFIPVLGLLDDLILLPLGIALALRLIPPEVMRDSRERVRADPPGPANRRAAAVIVLVWVLIVVAAAWLVWRR
ncbi:MAG: DUF1232 domain-containing protein [Thermomicrobiales bacterium]